MRFSLIVATLGRAELDRCFASLVDQAFRDFEVIVVDQGPADLVKSIVANYSDKFPIQHLRSEKGLSKARNVGIAVARGEIFAFPDDDAWYSPDLLANVDAAFSSDRDIMGVTGRCTDLNGNVSAGGLRRNAGPITRENVWHSGVSTSMFLRREVFETVGFFDEDLGLGSRGPFQSGEETDLLLRAALHGHKLIYAPEIRVFHPLAPPANVPGVVAKNWGYALGMGRVLRKHDESQARVAGWIGRAMTGGLVALLQLHPAHARLRFARAMGLYAGWRCADDGQSIRPPVWLHT
ncbi:MAG: glycosyltransferase [Beijerinckiaceae bacterium]|nr:glycosyltransferase [Beijerinckiaceae bacterium]